MSSPMTRDLFAAAREDAPDAAAREKAWERITVATGVAAGIAAAGAATAASSAPAVAASTLAKLFTICGVVGTIGALGVVTALAADWPARAEPPSSPASRAAHDYAQHAHTVNVAQGARLIDAAPRPRHSAQLAPAATPAGAASTSTAPHHEPPSHASPVDDLTSEARLVTDARAALVAGDPARALALIRATHRLAARALEPEELGVEARALRALGRPDEALACDLALKRSFPGHALAR